MALEKIPVLYEHCLNTYNLMAAQATMQDEQGEDILIYEGFLTHLFREELHLSIPYYSTVTKKLKNMGCIQQVRRGGSTTPSRWVIIKPPTLEAFRTEVAAKKAKTPKEQNISDLNRRVGDLETTVEALVEAASK